MKNLLKFLLVMLSFIANSQTQGENYIKTVIYKTPTTVKITAPTISQAAQNVTYFDGLGRPVQKIDYQQSKSGKDIVTHIEYDGFGRQVEEYLPFKAETNDMTFDPLVKTKLLSYYSTSDPTRTGNPAMETTIYPFSRKELEASPLSRVLKQAAPGNSWYSGSGHEIKVDYQTNAQDEVILFTATTLWNATSGLYDINLNKNGFYSPNELFKTITYDENTQAPLLENNGATVEFKNKEGQVVLKRTYGTVGTGTTNEKYDTYYVYDIYGNLAYVIPPKAVDLISSSAGLQADAPSTAIVTSGNSLHLKASNSITLKDGFHAQAGSVFSAVIDNGNQTILNDLCYQYKYDSRNRMTEKKLPGKQWEFVVYDKLDRVVATGPANSPFSDITSSGWIITKYDAFSRPVYTGWFNSSPATAEGRTALQTAQNTAAVINESKLTNIGTLDGISAYYSNNVAPQSFKLLTINYYDNYDFLSISNLTVPLIVEGQNILSTSKIKGLSSGSWTRVLSTASSTAGEATAIFYDDRSRPVRNYSLNYLGGYTYTDSKLDFSGKTEYSITRHKRTANDAELLTKDAFTYSAQDRLLTQTHQITNNGALEIIADNTYDELGQLISKQVGNNTQNINYNYNIRGWLTGINDISALTKPGDQKDLFAFKINYNTASTPGVDPLYNGNIAETYWATNSDNGIVRGYGYKYDNLNRLKTGISLQNGSVNHFFDETVTYDKNGNIMSMARNGNNALQQIDNLIYTYSNNNNSNQLIKVNDVVINNPNLLYEFKDSASNTVDDYSYDANGNMTKDNNKNITEIKYNHLNLPTQISFASTGNIVYIYNAAGQKMQKIVNETGKPIVTTDYLGSYQYETQNSVTTLKFFSTAEGYVEKQGSSYKYVYQYKDHLGNIRLSYDKNLTIQEETNYYPFGLEHTGYNGGINSTNTALKYKYNGKELQDELGLNMYDYGARNYDPALGRWMNIDPLAEHSQSITPYHYCSNSPINRNDPTGMCDDPNCPHGAIRRGWDAVGRFFGAWGHSDSNSAVAQNNSNISVGPIQEVASQLTSSTSAGVTQVDLIPENPLAKLDYSTSKTIGDAKMFNTSSKTTFNATTGSTDSSVDNQLNLGIANFNFETASSSISFGGEVSAFGRLGLGISVSLSSDIISSNVSINGNGNLNGDNTSSTLSAGIKPLGIAAATLGVIIERFVPAPLIPYGAQMSTLPIAGQAPNIEY
ncbi:DUF6443 domain-containing protein [Flavobacterium anhuiense]|uniref:DUF6443 domain-containing protein n=1 Tax=Flavobacterium anhuiense TaxID=459526 RepID=UPI0034D97723